MIKLNAILIFFVALFGVQDQEVVSQGEWDNYSRWTTFEGSWKIVKSGDVLYVEMGSDFEAKKAPDLKLFLSKADLDDIGNKNALKIGAPVLVAKLTSYEGKASYKIPEGINLSDYKTIMVHCEEYSKFWGGASLN